MEGPKFSKRRKLGKNKKKSWRGIDISATEDFLEDQRFQLRTTGLMAEKSNDQLFLVAREGSKKSTDTNEKTSRRPIRGDLRCYSVLVNKSKIQCPRKEYPTDSTIESKAVHREVRSFRAQKRAAAVQKKSASSADTKEKKTKTSLDLWGDEKEETQSEDFYNEVTKRKRIQPPKHMKRTVSSRSAVDVPHAGASVNPAYDDHQDLLLQAHVVEMKKEKAERKLFNALDGKFPSAAEAPTEATWIQEMSAGLYKEKADAMEEAVDDSHISINPPVNREKKKTPREKRKEKAAKLMKQQIKKKKTEKELENKVFSIPKIRKELAQEKRQQSERVQTRAKKLEEKKFTPKKLGKTKVVAPDLEVKLSEELVGSLRCVKPEGHLLEDRYRSFQMRNMVEPRAKVNKKKTKRKKFEKKSFREVTV